MSEIKFLTTEQIELIASQIREKFDVKDDSFIDITQLAEKMGCKVYEAELDEKISGLVKSDNGGSIIYVNIDESEPRKRFTIAHELSHVILHHNDLENNRQFIDYRKPLSYYLSDDDLRKEIQANMLASALLMPKEIVKRIWKQIPQINNFAEFFRVSPKAASVRLDSLGLIE